MLDPREGHCIFQHRLTLKQALSVGCSLSSLLGVELVGKISPALAQVSSDGSFNTLVNQSATDSCTAALCTITGGIANDSGSVLLHSFEQFSLSNAQEARFIDPGVDDIVVRVTGSSTSVINGTLATSAGSAANLFLVNPQGISFGPGAQLNLGGSFLASSADQILFEGGTALEASSAAPAKSALLNVSAPIGLGFLPNSSSAPISVQGTGNLLTFGSPTASPEDQFVNRIFRGPLPPGVPLGAIPPFSELSVQPGQTISLIGRGVTLAGGNLTANSGQIVIGSVAEGIVGLDASSQPDFSQVSAFDDIQLTDSSSLEVSSSTPGSVLLQGQNITFSGASAVLAEMLPGNETPPGNSETASTGRIDIEAVDLVRITDSPRNESSVSGPPFFTYLSVDVAPSASGAGGEINLQSRNLAIDNGGQIGANTYGIGDAGLLNVAVEESIDITAIGLYGSSGLFSVAGTIGSGKAGRIEIDSNSLRLSQGAFILTDSNSIGSSGNIDVDVNTLTLEGVSEPIEISLPDGSIETIVVPSSIQSDNGFASSQQGGKVNIDAQQIAINNGARITSTNQGPGDAGEINILSDQVEISGFDPSVGVSTISTITGGENATGDGGSLNLQAEQLSILNGAQIATGTVGPGNAGNLNIISESVLISGGIEQGRSGLLASAVGGSGNGGDLSVQADELRVTEGGTISVGNFLSGSTAQVPPGQGNAGNLTIEATTINLDGQATLNAETAAGDRGNINLTTRALTLRNNSQISANAINDATGGNINIDASTGFVVAVPEENSDITANAVFGNGGQVNIAAQSVLGIEARPELTPLSDITTSSQFGIAGETQLENLETEVRQEVTSLPQSNEVPAVVQGCRPGGDRTGRFVQTGRGGVSASPYGVLNSRNSLEDISLPSRLDSSTSTEPSTPAESSIQTEATVLEEAQGWDVNSQGEIVLLATRPQQNNSDRCLTSQP